jgi:hypothetical protein
VDERARFKGLARSRLDASVTRVRTSSMWGSGSAAVVRIVARIVMSSVGVGVIVASCGGTRVAQPRVGVAPERVSGIYLCLPPDVVAVYHNHAYPTNEPSPPPKTVRPERCFTSTAQAARAGHPIASTPAHDRVIGGVYLVPPAATVEALCRRSTRVAELAVPCPTLVPGPPSSLSCDTATPCAQPGWFVLEGTFAGGPGHVGVPAAGGGHLWIIAFTARAGVWPADTLAGGHLVRNTHVRGHPARVVSYPFGSGLNSCHVVLIWREGRTTYAVSLHGHTKVNERLDVAIAAHLRLLSR